MLDSKGNETSGSLIMENDIINAILAADFRTSEHTQVVPRTYTVKEMLMMKRQRLNDFQDNNNNNWGSKCKYARYEAPNNSMSPPLMGLPAPPFNSNIINQFSPGNEHVTPQQHPAVQGQVSPASEVKMSFFQWQILQETKKVGQLHFEQLNMQDADGDTFLHIAVAQGKRALAYVLAREMATWGSLDLKEHNGQTALQLAAASNQPLLVNDLLSHGAQINTRDLWGRSPLHVCAEKGHFLSLQSIWKALKQNGRLIDIEMFNYDGLTPLHTAVLAHNAVVKELRTLGNSCSYMTQKLGQRRQTYVESIKALLLMGASFGTKDLKSGRTCLHMAAEEANMELFHIFLSQPLSLSIINEKMFNGNSALHVVSSLQNHKAQVEAVKLLVRKGADPGIRNIENELPSQLLPEGPTGEKVRQILKGKYIPA
ncbi:uncharacterized protein V6R79_019623 [Siganus canaliculatus]